jgi:hypothetical protein
MRISDDRYSRERSSLELALRFLRHEARTRTIRTWTGLSDDRIRNLYRSYVSREMHAAPRHRGKSPRQAAYFIRSARLQQETAALASYLYLAGAVPTRPQEGAAALSVARGELLCCAFEAYRALLPSAQISFEHAVFLVTSLSRPELIRMDQCAQCGGLVVTETFPRRELLCQHCVASEARNG